MNDTKLKGDYAELIVASKALKFGWGVSKPIGDRLPYDLIFDVRGKLLKIQVKSAWRNKDTDTFRICTQRCKTNRRHMKRESYKDSDFDFAIVFIEEKGIFYIMPIKFFNSFKSSIYFAEPDNKQRAARSDEYKERWNLLENETL